METPHKVTKADHETASAQVMWDLTLTRQKQGAEGRRGEVKKWEDGSGLFNKKPEIDLASPSSSLRCFRAQTKKGTRGVYLDAFGNLQGSK